jgi:hypothetical protein
VAVVVLAGVLASWFVFASAAPAADSDLTAAALDARKAVGLPAVTESPAVAAAAGAVLDGADSHGAFVSKGGTGDLVTVAWPAGGALSADPVRALVFDPRVSALAVLGRGGTVAVAAALDPGRPFHVPVVAGAGFDPGVPGSLAVLFPPAAGTIPPISLQAKRQGQLVTIGLAATAVPGVEDAILVELRGRDRITGPQIGYGLTYTLKIGTNRLYTVRTRPIPTALTSRPFVAGPGFSGVDKQRFLRDVSSMSAAGRNIVDTIRGAVTVSVLANSAPICGAQTDCAGFDPGNGYFMIVNRADLHSSFGRFAISHEFGHLVDFLGLDTFSHQSFTKLFSASPKWKSCFPLRSHCTPSLEVFADQFGFFSTNARGVQTGYGDDRLATGPAFSSVLRAQWAFRPPQELNPLAGYGPLARSFELAMQSSASAL